MKEATIERLIARHKRTYSVNVRIMFGPTRMSTQKFVWLTKADAHALLIEAMNFNFVCSVTVYCKKVINGRMQRLSKTWEQSEERRSAFVDEWLRKSEPDYEAVKAIWRKFQNANALRNLSPKVEYHVRKQIDKFKREKIETALERQGHHGSIVDGSWEYFYDKHGNLKRRQFSRVENALRKSLWVELQAFYS